jgi:hypothetical protein
MRVEKFRAGREQLDEILFEMAIILLVLGFIAMSERLRFDWQGGTGPGPIHGNSCFLVVVLHHCGWFGRAARFVHRHR